MTGFDLYTLILCLVVFILLTVLSIMAITLIYRYYVRLVKVGAEDDKLLEEYNKQKEKKHSKIGKAIEVALAVILLALFAFVFSGSIYINCTQNKYFENVPTYRVVKTGSMSKKYYENTYLFDNDLNDQIQIFDLIATYKTPKEEDLEVYDIVVYEVDGVLLVHRIVAIEEPNEKHPNERYFLLQGDAVERPDRFPVRYSQIKGIYKGGRVPFIGSFVLFMQSPAGWLCMLLVAFATFATPVLDKKIKGAKTERLAKLGVSSNSDNTAKKEN